MRSIDNENAVERNRPAYRIFIMGIALKIVIFQVSFQGCFKVRLPVFFRQYFVGKKIKCIFAVENYMFFFDKIKL